MTRFNPQPPKAPRSNPSRPATTETAVAPEIFKNTNAILEAIYGKRPYKIPENTTGSDISLTASRRGSQLEKIERIYQTPGPSRQVSQQASRQSSPLGTDLAPPRRQQPSVAFAASSGSRKSVQTGSDSSSDGFLPRMRQHRQQSDQPFRLSNSQVGMWRSSSSRAPRREQISFILPQDAARLGKY